jgi:hypothetical protein
MHINNNKEKTSSICMQITQQPSIRNISHQMLHTMKCQINMCCIMHCQKDTSQNLQYQTQSSQNSPIIIPIQIRRGRITNLMVLNHSQNRLIPQTSTQFFHISSHSKNKKRGKTKKILMCPQEFAPLPFENQHNVVQIHHNLELLLDVSM